MPTYCNGTGGEWYTGEDPGKERLAQLAEKHGACGLDIHDAPEITAQAVYYLIDQDSEDGRWLKSRWPELVSA